MLQAPWTERQSSISRSTLRAGREVRREPCTERPRQLDLEAHGVGPRRRGRARALARSTAASAGPSGADGERDDPATGTPRRSPSGAIDPGAVARRSRPLPVRPEVAVDPVHFVDASTSAGRRLELARSASTARICSSMAGGRVHGVQEESASFSASSVARNAATSSRILRMNPTVSVRMTAGGPRLDQPAPRDRARDEEPIRGREGHAGREPGSGASLARVGYRERDDGAPIRRRPARWRRR